MLWRMSATRFEAPPPRLCRLSCGIAASGDFGARLVELVFDFLGQLKPVFEIVFNPFANLLNFFTRQLWDRCLNPLDRAHANNLAQLSPIRREKPWLLITTRACQSLRRN